MSSEQIQELQKQIQALQAQLNKVIPQVPEPIPEPVKVPKKKVDLGLLFASSDEPFSFHNLRDLINNKEFKKAKTYLRKYYAILYEGKKPFIHWNPYKKELIEQDDKELRNHLSKAFDFTEYVKGKQCTLFSAYHFIKDDMIERFMYTVDYNNKKVFRKDNLLFINKFGGYLHQERKPYKSFSKEVKQYIDVMWNHIFETWCSSNEDQFFYVKHWLCGMISGEKMTSILYLRSVEEGIGKTIPCEFIFKKVLGTHLCYVVDNPQILTDGFNSPLCGMMFVLGEELPSNTESAWRNLTNWLKSWATNSSKEFKGKYMNNFNAPNVSSFIFLTNCDALVISQGDRRFVMIDTSDKYLGNTQYFENLALCLDGPDSDLIGEAFYWNCIETNEKYFKDNGRKFNAQKDRPVTKTKQGVIIDHLHTLYVFLKKHFIAKQKGISKQKVTVFKELYLSELKYDAIRTKQGEIPIYKNHDLSVNERKISELLKRIGIKTFAGSGNYTTIPEVSYEDLYKIFNDKHWIDEFDNIAEWTETKPTPIRYFSNKIQSKNEHYITKLEELERCKNEYKQAPIIKLIDKSIEYVVDDEDSDDDVINESIRVLSNMKPKILYTEPDFDNIEFLED